MPNVDPYLPVRVGKAAEKPKIYEPSFEQKNEDPKTQRKRWLTLLGYNRDLVSHSDPQGILLRSRMKYILLGTFIFVDIVLGLAYFLIF